MDITEVVKASGLPASTLRFYEQKGLIQSYGREGLRRLFSADVIERLALIALGRSADLSLAEIGAMLTPDGPAIDRTLLAAKAETLDQKIRSLTAMRDGLRHAAACKAPNHLECPKFLRLLNIVQKKQVRTTDRLASDHPPKNKLTRGDSTTGDFTTNKRSRDKTARRVVGNKRSGR
jgi:DNA-binding transcriptional MerR regulator